MNISTLKAKPDLDFDQAQTLAFAEARNSLPDPMLLAWLNRQTGRHCPNVDCCQTEDKESWEIYAESRGGSLRVEIGNEFVFIFRAGLDE